MFIIGATPLILIIVLLVVRGRRGSGGSDVGEGIKRIIASTGDVSAGMAGAKKLKFLKTPSQALVFLKIEENAIQQALSAIDYYNQQGDIDETVKDKLEAYYVEQERKKHEERAQARKIQVGSGDRSERIRTYNFPQNRVTDHRINLTLYKLEEVLLGGLEEIIEALKLNAREESLKSIAS